MEPWFSGRHRIKGFQFQVSDISELGIVEIDCLVEDFFSLNFVLNVYFGFVIKTKLVYKIKSHSPAFHNVF